MKTKNRAGNTVYFNRKYQDRMIEKIDNKDADTRTYSKRVRVSGDVIRRSK